MSYECPECHGEGDCDYCDSIDGRWIEAVNEYASTCDGCGELTHHDYQLFDPSVWPEVQLSYCEECRPDLHEMDPDIYTQKIRDAEQHTPAEDHTTNDERSGT